MFSGIIRCVALLIIVFSSVLFFSSVRKVMPEGFYLLHNKDESHTKA